MFTQEPLKFTFRTFGKGHIKAGKSIIYLFKIPLSQNSVIRGWLLKCVPSVLLSI
jgi:hypothetical protein